jgi:RNA-directed DNA polymerase
MQRDRSVALRLAFSLLASEWNAPSLRSACQEFFGPETGPAFVDLREVLVAGVLARYPTAPRDSARELAQFIHGSYGSFGSELIDDSERINEAQEDQDDEDQTDEVQTDDAEQHRQRRLLDYSEHGPMRMPVAAAQMLRNRWGVPILHTVGELAEFLEVPLSDLAWFADRRGLQIRETKDQLHHYTYRWVPKRDGSFRLLEQPKPRLKQMQRAILHRILNTIPVHDAVHGFVAGRTVVSAALPHAGRRVLLRFDLHNFFGSVGAGRVYGIFRTCGYPEAVAHALTGLVTNRVPNHVIAQGRPLRGHSVSTSASLRTPHLPQGAPTSPGLANLAANGIDRRLDGLAKKHHATYTRYADDLFVSGDDRLFQRAKSFSALTEYLIASEGFRVHHGKTAHMTNAGRQQLLGLVVNDHPAIARTEFDALRATLHNCVRFGSESQRRDQTVDFRSHLLGRIGWVAFVNPQRGARLMSVFNQITWLKQQ